MSKGLQNVLGIIVAVVAIVVSFYVSPVVGQMVFLAGTMLTAMLVKQDTIEGSRRETENQILSEYGASIPLIFGAYKVQGRVIYSENLKEVKVTKKKSGAKYNVYYYYANALLLLSEGEINRVRRIWANENLIYSDREEDEIENKFTIFNGNETEAKSYLVNNFKSTPITLQKRKNNQENGGFYLYNGNQQEASSFIQEKLNIDNLETYKGYSLVFVKNFPLLEYGNGMPNFSFEIIANLKEKYVDKNQNIKLTEIFNENEAMKQLENLLNSYNVKNAQVFYCDRSICVNNQILSCFSVNNTNNSTELQQLLNKFNGRNLIENLVLSEPNPLKPSIIKQGRFIKAQRTYINRHYKIFTRFNIDTKELSIITLVGCNNRKIFPFFHGYNAFDVKTISTYINAPSQLKDNLAVKIEFKEDLKNFNISVNSFFDKNWANDYFNGNLKTFNFIHNDQPKQILEERNSRKTFLLLREDTTNYYFTYQVKQQYDNLNFVDYYIKPEEDETYFHFLFYDKKKKTLNCIKDVNIELDTLPFEYSIKTAIPKDWQNILSSNSGYVKAISLNNKVLLINTSSSDTALALIDITKTTFEELNFDKTLIYNFAVDFSKEKIKWDETTKKLYFFSISRLNKVFIFSFNNHSLTEKQIFTSEEYERIGSVNPYFSNGKSYFYGFAKHYVANNILNDNQTQTTLSTILKRLLDYLKIKNYDLSEIKNKDKTIQGVVFNNPTSLKSNLEHLSSLYKFLIVEENGVLKFKYINKVIKAIIKEEELNADFYDDLSNLDFNNKVKKEYVADFEIPQRYELSFVDQEKEFQNNIVEETAACVNSSISKNYTTPLNLSENQAKNIVQDLLNETLSGRETLEVQTDLKYDFLNVGDLIQVEDLNKIYKTYLISKKNKDKILIKFKLTSSNLIEETPLYDYEKEGLKNKVKTYSSNSSNEIFNIKEIKLNSLINSQLLSKTTILIDKNIQNTELNTSDLNVIVEDEENNEIANFKTKRQQLFQISEGETFISYLSEEEKQNKIDFDSKIVIYKNNNIDVSNEEWKNILKKRTLQEMIDSPLLNACFCKNETFRFCKAEYDEKEEKIILSNLIRYIKGFNTFNNNFLSEKNNDFLLLLNENYQNIEEKVNQQQNNRMLSINNNVETYIEDFSDLKFYELKNECFKIYQSNSLTKLKIDKNKILLPFEDNSKVKLNIKYSTISSIELDDILEEAKSVYLLNVQSNKIILEKENVKTIFLWLSFTTEENQTIQSNILKLKL